MWRFSALFPLENLNLRRILEAVQKKTHISKTYALILTIYFVLFFREWTPVWAWKRNHTDFILVSLEGTSKKKCLAGTKICTCSSPIIISQRHYWPYHHWGSLSVDHSVTTLSVFSLFTILHLTACDRYWHWEFFFVWRGISSFKNSINLMCHFLPLIRQPPVTVTFISL